MLLTLLCLILAARVLAEPRMVISSSASGKVYTSAAVFETNI